LAEIAICFCTKDAVPSHLSEIEIADWFILVRVTMLGTRAIMVYEIGNGYELARQDISFYRISPGLANDERLLSREALDDHAGQ
jgi:hypothetical protein